MRKQYLIQVLLISLCVHLVVFWPRPRPEPLVSSVKNVALTVRITPAAKVTAPLPKLLAEAANSEGLRPGSSQGKRLVVGAVPSDGVRGHFHSKSGALQSTFPRRILREVDPVAEEIEESHEPKSDLLAYRFALAVAAFEYRPDSSESAGRGLQGVAVVGVRFIGASTKPVTTLLDSSGVVVLDDLALEMVRRAVERVPSPSQSEGQDRFVKLSLVFEGEQQ